MGAVSLFKAIDANPVLSSNRDVEPCIGDGAANEPGAGGEPMAVALSMREVEENLDRILTRVEDGEEIEITRHGRVVARLIPPPRANIRDEDEADRLWNSLAKKATSE
jgi:prevent-host-death family protein